MSAQRCYACKEQVDAVGRCFNQNCENYRGKEMNHHSPWLDLVAPENAPSIKSKSSFPMTELESIRFLESIYRLSTDSQHEAILLYMQEQAERIEQAETNTRHLRDFAGKQDAQIKALKEERDKAKAEAVRIDRQASQYSEEICSAFRKHGLAAGPTALDRVMEQLEEARKALYMPGDWKCPTCEGSEENYQFGVKLMKENETLAAQLKIANEKQDKLEGQWQSLMSAILELDPTPACKREDGQLEPPAEVVRRVRAEREEARKARDLAEAKARRLDGVQACQSVRELVASLPPDVLMHPMPFPDRLDYAAKIIQAWLTDQLSAAIPRIAEMLAERYGQNEEIGLDEEWWPRLLELFQPKP